MRILVSNPDTIGDVILRQPLYAALQRDGHELMLIVRKSVAALAPYVAPAAKVVVPPIEVYRDDLPMHWDALAETFRVAREFEPDLLVVAPYQWTQFEEKLAEELPGIRRIGMNGRLYRGDPHAGRSPESKLWFDVVAGVKEDQPEVEKNASLAQTILGRPLQLDLPTLLPDETSLARARQTLERVGLEPGGFWIAAVAGTRHVHLKQWNPQRWGETLVHAAATFGRRFLFVGLPEERPVIESVRLSMGDVASHGTILADAETGIDQLIALTSLAGGYIGHDTGPMHVAAALGKPVLAVFGGGTWPRFVPAVEPSCAIMVGVPCTGCGWVCGFKRPHCIDDVPAPHVKQAVDDLESGRIKGRELRVIPAAAALQDQMVRESAEIVRQQQRETAEVVRQLHETRAAEAEQRQLAAERQKHAAEIARLGQAFEAHSRQSASRHAQELMMLSESLSAQFAAAMEVERASQAKIVEQLTTRLGHIEGRLGPPRTIEPVNWAARVARWIAGTNTYSPGRAARPLPRLSLIISANSGFREAIESVLAQSYPHMEILVVAGAPDACTRKVLDESGDRIDCVISDDAANLSDLVASACDRATGEIFGYFAADTVLEPGALLHVGEHFRDRPSAQVIYHQDTMADGAWRFSRDVPARLDVYQLLNRPDSFNGGLFFRRSAWVAIGGIDRSLKGAGVWSMIIRLIRMWGAGQARGDIISTRVRPERVVATGQTADQSEWQTAKAEFLTQFGLAGRIRCRVIQWCNVIRNAIARRRRTHLHWPLKRSDKPLPPGVQPQHHADQPTSSITGRPPDRLLFSTPDTRTGDRRIHHVYYESMTGLAMACPALSGDAESVRPTGVRAELPGEVISPDPNYSSPFQNFRGGNFIIRNLSRIPSPWWWTHDVAYHDPTVSEIVQAARFSFAPDDADVRFLEIGCAEGKLLDQLKARTQWKLAGIESNAAEIESGRSKGYEIWQAAAEDAPVVVPEGVAFDLIFLGRAMEHWDDPLVGLNRLKLLLAPGGRMVIAVPNLDSTQVELFGPTWAHWNLPRHRTLLSRRALRRLAGMAGMRIERLCTRTHPYWTTMSVQLNRLGLGAVVPPGAKFPNAIAMHGTRLTGWSRLLWDWRGRGDYMIALLRPH